MRIVAFLNLLLYALPLFAGSKPEPLVDHWWQAVKTITGARTLQTSIEAYHTDYNRYPDAKTIDDLAKVISPVYVRTAPLKDGWGNDFIYIVSADGRSYTIASGGSDGATDEKSWTAAGYSTQSSDDLVYKNGDFTREWVVQRVCK
jgi:hypothetical protein